MERIQDKRSFTKWFYALLLFIILTVLSIQSPVGITYFPLMMIIFVPLLFIAWLIKLETIGKVHIRKYSIPFLSAILLSFFVSVETITYERSETQKSASKIIEALENYRDVNKGYPNELSDLKPQYITEIPKTKMGWMNVSFRYSTYRDSKDFKMGFKYIAMTSCYYDSERHTWITE